MSKPFDLPGFDVDFMNFEHQKKKVPPRTKIFAWILILTPLFYILLFKISCVGSSTETWVSCSNGRIDDIISRIGILILLVIIGFALVPILLLLGVFIESVFSETSEPSAKSNNKYNDNSHNATCVVCKKGFKGASLARHETGRYANKIVRVGLMTPFVGLFSLLGWFDDDSYTPVCSNCCIICKLPKSNCDGHVSEDLGDDL